MNNSAKTENGANNTTGGDQLQAANSVKGFFRQPNRTAPSISYRYLEIFAYALLFPALSVAAVWEDGMLEDRRFSFALDRAQKDPLVVEPELDMNREARRHPVMLTRISQFIRWLMPDSKLVRPPMRSVAREFEELFPSCDN